MNIDYKTMIVIRQFLLWVLKNKEDTNNFYSNVLNQFDVYYKTAESVSVFNKGITFCITYDLASDIASVVNKYFNAYNFMGDMLDD